MIESDDLRFFQRIAAYPSLAAAARGLNVTPPSVSQRLKGLEEKLGLVLMQRHARSVSLTDEGRYLLEHANTLLADLDELRENLLAKKDIVSGQLRVIAPLGFGSDHVAPVIAEFRKRHRHVAVELQLSDQPDWSAGEGWDIMIYIGALRDSALTRVRLMPNRRFLCAAPGYIETYGQPETPMDLRRHDCIALRENAEDVTLWRLVDHTDGCEQTIRISPAMASNEGSVVKQWALSGLGIIARSQWDVAPQLRDGSLVRLLPNYDLPDADIVALMGSGAQARSARSRDFLDLLKRRLRERLDMRLSASD